MDETLKLGYIRPIAIEYLLSRKEHKAEIAIKHYTTIKEQLVAFQKTSPRWNKLISLIKKSPDKETATEKISNYFDLNSYQVQILLSTKLADLVKIALLNFKKEIEQLEKFVCRNA